MAPIKNKTSNSLKNTTSTWQSFRNKYMNKQFAANLIYNPRYLLPTCVLLFIFEIILNIFIIENVRYTEIDWVAYMQEVEGFLNGTLDYSKLRGKFSLICTNVIFIYISFFLQEILGLWCIQQDLYISTQPYTM